MSAPPPSRDDWPEYVQRAGDGYGIDYQEAADIIALAFPNGAVDREAIDYEAAAKYLSTLIYQSPEGSWPDEFLPYAKVESRNIVDAALGEV